MLAVPESAVIDTGSRKVVYREAGPSLYDGVEVELGPRCGEFYPVVQGLEAGDRVATDGSFLIDAETRLAGGLGSTYFGASAGPQQKEKTAVAASRPSATSDDDAEVEAAMKQLGPDDRKAAEAQELLSRAEDPPRHDGRADQGGAQGPAGLPLLPQMR